MAEEHPTQGAEGRKPQEGTNDDPGAQTEMCPMASMFEGMAAKPGTGLLLMIPGLALVVVGVAIFFEPKVLFWLIGAMTILIGIAVLAFASFIRKMAVS